MDKITFIASASELQSSNIYMTIKMNMFSADVANLNHVMCTKAFVDEIVEHQDNYISLPLVADVKNLELGRDDKLTHCYNEYTRTFSTWSIGSFYQFEEEVDEESGVVSLIGYARVWKRNQAVCNALAELFAEGKLKFSFEVACGKIENLEDGTRLIDRDPENYLEAMCVVSFPAYPDAVAQQLVAEINDQLKEAESMDKPNENTEVAEVNAEEATENTEEVVSEQVAEETPAAEETSEVITTTTTYNETENVQYNTDTDTEEVVRTTETHVVRTFSEDELAQVRQIASEQAKPLADVLSEIKTMLSEIQKSLSQAEEETVVTSEVEHVVSEIVQQPNGFVSEIDSNGNDENEIRRQLLSSSNLQNYGLLG